MLRNIYLFEVAYFFLILKRVTIWMSDHLLQWRLYNRPQRMNGEREGQNHHFDIDDKGYLM